MNFWEPSWQEAAYTIAMFLMLAVVLAPLSGWAPADDTNEMNATGSEPQAEKGIQP